MLDRPALIESEQHPCSKEIAGAGRIHSRSVDLEGRVVSDINITGAGDESVGAVRQDREAVVFLYETAKPNEIGRRVTPNARPVGTGLPIAARRDGVPFLDHIQG